MNSPQMPNVMAGITAVKPGVDQQPGVQNGMDISGPVPELNMKGRFARYTSPFLSLMLPLLATRYLWIAIEDINPLNFLQKPAKANESGIIRYISRNIKALGMGATVMTVLGFYSKRTMDDIKNIYAEAVSYELGKKPEDVTLHDVFFKSRNEALKITRGDFARRTLARGAAAGSFLIPWHRMRHFKGDPSKSKIWNTNIDSGVGIMGTYLSLDGFTRKQTFFEAQQDMVDTAINHDDTNINHQITARDIESLLFLQRKRINKNYNWPPVDSKEGASEDVLAARIADLMNQTYKNVPNTEQAHFTLGKFNYLVGFGMLDHYPESLGFVELANRSPDMKEVKAAALAIKNGQNPETVFQTLGIDIHNPVSKNVAAVEMQGSAPGKYIDNVQPIRDKVPALQRTHREFAENVAGSPLISP